MSVQALNAPRRGRFEVGNVLGAVGEAFRKHFLVLFALSLLLYGLPIAAGGALQQTFLLPLMQDDPIGWIRTPTGISVYLAVVAISFIASYVLQAALIQAVVGSLLRRPASFSDCLATGLRYLLPSLVIAVLFVFAVTFGLILVIVPGLILALGWCVAVPAMVVERLNPISALGRSWSLTDGLKGQIFLLMLVWIGLNLAFNLVTNMVFFLITMIASAAGPQALAWFQVLVILPVLSSIIVMASGAGIAAIYFELRSAKEGFGSDDLASVFA